MRYLYSMRIICTLTICLICISCPGQGEPNGEIKFGGGTRESDTPNQGRESPFIIESGCQYNHFNGMARITSIAWTTADPGLKDSPMVADIIFSFTPESKPAYRFPGISDQNQHAKIFLHATFLERGKKELVTGGNTSCVRNEIIAGTCTPVVFSFPDYETQK
ncbi:MAG: hypothetical protein EHM28_08095 [Spirochaetaceae bacterium]|nr:MAG: hypothetical protein EHM28_08095 [Spirochaetaceae bacterium]